MDVAITLHVNTVCIRSLTLSIVFRSRSATTDISMRYRLAGFISTSSIYVLYTYTRYMYKYFN